MNREQIGMLMTGLPIDRVLKTFYESTPGYQFSQADKALKEQGIGFTDPRYLKDPKITDAMLNLAMSASVNSPTKVGSGMTDDVLGAIRRVTNQDPVSEVGKPDNLKRIIAKMRSNIDDTGKVTPEQVNKLLKATDRYKPSTTNASVREGFEDLYARADRVNAGNYKPVVDDVADPLINEARKYKSAEEFVKNQKPVFHGTDKVFDKFDDNASREGGAWFTDRAASLKDNSITTTGKGVVMERYINPNAKLLDIENNPADAALVDNLMPEELIQRGYAGIKSSGDNEGEVFIHLFNPNKDTVTKSQLTDIWNKANRK